MRLLGIFVCMSWIAAFAQAQPAIVNGPTLGFTSDDAMTSIRPILGIAGASILGDRLQLDTNLRVVTISPKHDYAIAARVDDGQIVVVDLRGDTPLSSAVTGTHPGGDVIAISPTGSTAAAYDKETRTVQIIGGQKPPLQLLYELDASRIPGDVVSIALSDDGAVALVKFVDADTATLWVMDSSGASWPISADQPSATAFFPNTSDAIVADDSTQSVFLLMDVRHGAARVPLISAEEGLNTFSAVAASDDGRRVFVADPKAGNVAVVDMETRRPALAWCGCRSTGFYLLKGNLVFGLSQASREPMMVLDASDAEPRIVVVPPSASTVTEAQ